MWKVLLVEDEILVRESVKRIIPWEELGFTVIAEADNGDEAMACIRMHQPDLVITDIIMPIMNGVELLKAARKEGYQSRFIVLSCMSDFEYVREAMEYGASNYILKLSMNIESLNEALQKVKVELLNNSSQNSYVLQPYYENMWSQIGENAVPRQEDAFTQFPLPGYERLYVIILLMMHGPGNFTKEMLLQMDGLSSNTPQIIHTFTKWGQSTFFCWYANEAEANEAVIQLKAARRSAFPMEFSSVARIEQLYECWNQIMRLTNRIWYGEGTAALNSGTDVQRLVNDSNDLWTMERTIILLFEQMKSERCCEMIDKLFELMKQQGQSMYMVKSIATRLGQTFSRIMNTPLELQHEMVVSATHDELRAILSGMIQIKLKQWDRHFPILTDHPDINKIIQYIRTNYNQEINVKSLAKYAAMDEKYLSGLFKKKTGESLIHFLQRVRIRRAENYLLTTELSVSEIGAMVGYVNDNYFIKVFCRWTNQTPSQYRKSIQS